MIRPIPLSTALSAIAPVAALSFLLLSSATAQSNEEGWTPELTMEFRRLSGTAVSADGKNVAYVVTTPLMEGSDSKYLSHIWVAAADGSRNRQYTRGEYSASNPQFSPDGEWLGFLTKRGEGESAKTQVWAMPLFGGEARALTAAEENVAAYQWSPDSSRVAFTMQDPLSEERKTANEEKRDVILVDQQPRYRHLHVVTVEDEGSAQSSLQLTSGEMVVGSFDWSPKGNEIVFSHKPTDILDDSNLAGDLAIVTVPGAEELAEMQASEDSDEENADSSLRIVGESRVLVAGSGVENSPHWSPDGNWVAYTSTGTEPNLISLGDVYVIGASGGDGRKLAETPNRSANIIDWSSSSDEIILSELLGTKRAVMGLPLRGEELQMYSPSEGVASNVSIAGDNNTLVYSWETADTPWDLYVKTAVSDKATKISNLHDDIEMPPQGKTELLSWTTDDGFEIEGLLTYPVDYKEGNSYPIILNVHGGPSGVFQETFTGGQGVYLAQVFAQQGYAVLRPNPRGSTGYGYAFREATATRWGHEDLNDLLTGLDKVIDMGVGDADNQFLMGWSYGGYMTSWTVTQTDRFKAASMGAAITNLMSMSMTTDIRRYLIEHMGDYYWNDMEAYTKGSAMHHIEKVVTPTQVIHGQQDLRVPLDQGNEFYNALKYRGIDTEMIIYPRTPHGPREPKFLMDVTPRILTWFNKYRDE
ncbi:MAG: prolyl oligopeptidase family serine peptidase [Pseudohongiellaceae bacterium]